MADVSVAQQMNRQVEDILGPLGFESHTFLVDWYNAQVSDKFRLDYPAGTLGLVLISQPVMFERAFLPFLAHTWNKDNIRDPIDQCMVHYFGKVKEALRDQEIVSLHDFELTPKRRPKILVQTAGHVSGAVRFYRPEQFPTLSSRNYYPVCHHPRWGGWFALRGVLLFPEISCPSLTRTEPKDILSEQEACRMLELYNEHWQDWRWREEGGPEQKYSALQIKYFDTPPADRGRIIDELVGAARNDGLEIGDPMAEIGNKRAEIGDVVVKCTQPYINGIKDELAENVPPCKVKVLDEMAENRKCHVPEL